MDDSTWDSVLVPDNEHGDAWEMFHENSKAARHDAPIPNEEVRRRMLDMWTSLPYEGYPALDLPSERAPLKLSLEEAILSRETARDITSCPLEMDQLAALLHYAYGVTRNNTDGEYPRPFRVVPSGGAMYPLEIYFHTNRVRGLDAGLYHYNPTENRIRLLREGDQTRQISQALVQQNLPLDSGLMVFITALFERSVFKYRERGYRFILIEAGHVAQNMNLVANALGLGAVNIGGFFDREIDALLDLDGIVHSTLYCMAIGARGNRG